MTPRPFREDPACHVAFGRWPFKPREGVIPNEMFFLENPPNPNRGITLIKRRGKTSYYKKLRVTDQLSQAEAAALLHVSRMQLNRWVRAGDIRDRDVLGVSRILVSELLLFAKRKGKDTTLLGRLMDYHRKGGE